MFKTSVDCCVCWELEGLDQFHSRGEFDGQGSPSSKDLSGPLMSEYRNKLELNIRERVRCGVGVCRSSVAKCW